MLEAYDVRKLPETGAIIEEKLEPEWFGALLGDLGPDAFGLAPTAAGEASIRLRAVAGASTDLPAVRITGHARAPVHMDCVRCLARVEQTLEAELDLTLFPAAPEETPAPAKSAANEKKGKAKVEKIELSAEALDEGSYRGFEIDLPDLVREALLLEVQMNPTCEDEAACAARAAQLTGPGGKPEASEGPEDPIDPRWAPLQKFRLKSS